MTLRTTANLRSISCFSLIKSSRATLIMFHCSFICTAIKCEVGSSFCFSVVLLTMLSNWLSSQPCENITVTNLCLIEISFIIPDGLFSSGHLFQLSLSRQLLSSSSCSSSYSSSTVRETCHRIHHTPDD